MSEQPDDTLRRLRRFEATLEDMAPDLRAGALLIWVRRELPAAVEAARAGGIAFGLAAARSAAGGCTLHGLHYHRPIAVACESLGEALAMAAYWQAEHFDLTWAAPVRIEDAAGTTILEGKDLDAAIDEWRERARGDNE